MTKLKINKLRELAMQNGIQIARDSHGWFFSIERSHFTTERVAIEEVFAQMDRAVRELRWALDVEHAKAKRA